MEVKLICCGASKPLVSAIALQYQKAEKNWSFGYLMGENLPPPKKNHFDDFKISLVPEPQCQI